MAEDWIKTRTDLYRDPKVCRIAELLMDKDGDLARHVMVMTGFDMNVTRDVMRYVTVGALVTLWGVTRLQGERNGDDLMMRYATLNTIDDITNVPGFGPAMKAVGWAVDDEDGVVLPRFFEDYNVDPEGKAANKAAERQRRYREKLKAERDVTRDVTRDAEDDVTVTSRNAPREEKRREEKKDTDKRASRLPTDWKPSEEEIQFCRQERPDLEPDSVADQFRDYWAGVGGVKGRKADWPATWRNWVRNQRGGSKPINGHHDTRFEN